MRSDFEAANLILYYGMVNGFLDLVIWCLGPYVDETRDYGLFRRLLASLTRWLCNLWFTWRGHPEARSDEPL